jgi:scyllo-inositol 2-dehydrogenase (NADP+)
MQKIKIGLCSYGMSGRVFHAPFIHLHEGFDLIGAYERTKKLIQQSYNYTKSFDSFEDLLQNDVDVVVVNTPNQLHYEHAKLALLADKHVIIEKPFTVSVKEAEALQFLAQKQNKEIFIYHNRRWDSDFKTVCKVLQSKLLGNILEAEISFERFRQQLSAKLFKENGVLGSGLLYDLGPHLIDQALCLFGYPTALFATLKTQRLSSEVDDYFKIILFYNTGLQVTLKSSLLVKEPNDGYIMHGTNGSFRKPRGDVQEELLQANKKPNLTNWAIENKLNFGTLHYEKNGKSFRETIKSEYGNYYDFYDDVFNVLTQKKQPFVSVNDGINTIKIIEASIQSNQTKTVINLI